MSTQALQSVTREHLATRNTARRLRFSAKKLLTMLATQAAELCVNYCEQSREEKEPRTLSVVPSARHVALCSMTGPQFASEERQRRRQDLGKARLPCFLCLGSFLALGDKFVSAFSVPRVSSAVGLARRSSTIIVLTMPRRSSSISGWAAASGIEISE